MIKFGTGPLNGDDWTVPVFDLLDNVVRFFGVT